MMISVWSRPEITSPAFYHSCFVRAICEVFQVDVSNAGHSPEMEDSNPINILIVPARWLFANQGWFRSLPGIKILVEHDAYLNFMPESPWHRCWTKLYRQCNFDLLLSSGRTTTDRLREDGLPAIWLPKGTDKKYLTVENKNSGKVGYFGLPILEREVGKPVHFYESRHQMSDQLRDRLPLIASTFEDFHKVIPEFSAGVQNDATMGEPMAKHFEASAMGCAVIRDTQDELKELGYVDHESMICYEDWDEMREMIQYYGKESNRDKLEAIQSRGREVSENHTWHHRAQQILEVVKPYIRNRTFI